MSQPADTPPPQPTFSHASPVDAAGFTMIPNVIMRRGDLSPAAKLVYGYMKNLAWLERSTEVAPAQSEIASDLKMGERTVVEVLKELRRAAAAEGADEDGSRLVVSKRRGLGLTNAYVINPPLPPTETRHSGSADPAEPEPRDPRFPPSLEEKRTTEEEPPLPPLAQPPGIVLSDAGRNVPLDVLAEVCGVAEGSPRLVQAVVALNGRLHKTTGAILEPGIRHLFWNECRQQALAGADERPFPAQARADAEQRLRGLQGHPERFAELLAERIRKKADAYRRAMPGAMLTPKALRDWWLDVTAPAGFNPDDASRLPDV